MLMDWIEPTLEKRIYEVAIICDEKSAGLDKEIIEIYNNIKIQLPESFFDITSRLDEVFMMKMLRYVELTYRTAFNDGLSLYADMKNFR